MDFNNMSKEELINYINTLNENENGKYGLVWDKEKEPEQIVVDCNKMIPVLKEVEDKNISNNGENNLLIEGDNFHSLSVLNYTHKESIDVIYIDPPYNTGNEDFIYNDKFVNVDDGYRHSKWLNFMQKRLRIARELLKDDGIIMISIDDNEYAQLKLLCDKIFGESNRLSIHHVQVRYSDKTLNEKNDWQPVMEYVLIYAKNSNNFHANKPQEDYSIGKFDTEFIELSDGEKFEVGGRKVTVFKKGEWKMKVHKEPSIDLLKGTWVSGSIYTGTGNGTMVQKVIEPRVDSDGFECLYKIEGLGEDGLGYRYFTGPKKSTATRCMMYSGVPLERRKQLEDGSAIKYKSIPNIFDFSPDFGNIRHEGGVAFNSGKKPIKMLKEFINYHQNKNAIVLDFFAGSGSTGHAVLELNQEDGGHRKFILCTNNENNICEEITYKRIENVIKGYSNHEALKGSLKYLKTEFVPNEGTRSQLYYDLTEKCVPMLHVKEDTFEEVETNDEYSIYTNKDKTKYTCVYFDLMGEKYEEFKNKLRAISEKKSLYIFTLGNGINESELAGINNYSVEAVPQRIYELYKKVVKMSKED